MGNPKKLVSIDIDPLEKFNINVSDIKDAAKANNIEFEFILANDLEIEIEETDLLFIDTLHRYDQLKQELKLHGNKARKYIAFHDTDTFGKIGQGGGEGILKAINEFLNDNKNWVVYKKEHGSNGMMILKKNNI